MPPCTTKVGEGTMGTPGFAVASSGATQFVPTGDTCVSPGAASAGSCLGNVLEASVVPQESWGMIFYGMENQLGSPGLILLPHSSS